MATKFEKLQQKNVSLNLKGIKNKAEAKRRAGEILVDSILDHTQRGESPVANEGSYDKLDKKYAKREKGGFRLANLLLSGNMMDSVGHKRGAGDTVTVGILRGVGKSVSKMRDQANGHNWIDGRRGPKGVPKRRFIAGDNQKFIAQELADDFLDTLRPVDLTPPSSPTIADSITTTVDFEDLVSTENILKLIRARDGS